MVLAALTHVVTTMLSRQLFMMAKLYDDVVVFTLGDPDMPTPAPIFEALLKGVEKGETRYAPNTSIPELKEVIAKQVSKEIGIRYEANNDRLACGYTEENEDFIKEAIKFQQNIAACVKTGKDSKSF